MIETKKIYTITIIFCIFILISCQKVEKKQDKEVLRPVFYTQVGHSTEEAFNQEYSGVVQSAMESKISFRISGTIDLVKVKLGDFVVKDQIIAALQQNDLKLAYRKSIADKKTAALDFDTAVSNYIRYEKLYEKNNVSLAEFETAKVNKEAALSHLETARTNLQFSKNNIEYAFLKAPFSGVITEVYKELNENVAAGTPVFKVASKSDLDIVVYLPEAMIPLITSGQEAVISLKNFKKHKLKGKVYKIAYSADNYATTYPVIIRIINSDISIRPGMNAKVKFLFNKSKGDKMSILVPVDAVGKDSSGNFVYVILPTKLADEYVLRKRDVEIGEIEDNNFYIKKGLASGEFVVSFGLGQLYDGRKVTLMKR